MSAESISLFIIFFFLSGYSFYYNLKQECMVFVSILISLFFGSVSYFGSRGNIVLLLLSGFAVAIIQIIKYIHKNQRR